jgi:hypothetical protein
MIQRPSDAGGPVEPATEFKAKCLELMDRVAERREIGFIQARQLKPRDRYVLPDDEDW